jgi:hypothetical protein
LLYKWYDYLFQIFGDIAIPGMDKDIKLALEKGAKGIERKKMLLLDKDDI